MPATIRSAKPSDEAAITALWKACGLTVSYNDPGRDFNFALAKPGSDILVAIGGQARIAGAVMVGHDGHRGWLYYLAVEPDNRRQGVGRILVRSCEDWLRQRGIVKVQVMIRETNADVVRFYERIGYDPMPRINMQKWLKDRD